MRAGERRDTLDYKFGGRLCCNIQRPGGSPVPLSFCFLRNPIRQVFLAKRRGVDCIFRDVGALDRTSHAGRDSIWYGTGRVVKDRLMMHRE